MNDCVWNHNIHYHDLVLRSIPPRCSRALDVGCGQGLLTRKLATKCADVISIDANREVLSATKAAYGAETLVTFVEGDFMTYVFPQASFDLSTAVAALHHLPLRQALERYRDLLRPGGVRAIVGLYCPSSLSDFAVAATAVPASWALRVRRGFTDVGPVQNPRETLHEIRHACDAILPGSVLRRRLLSRYSLIWRKR